MKCWPYSWSEQDVRLEKGELHAVLHTPYLRKRPVQKLEFQVDPKEEADLERREEVRGGLL